jgi:hypothetical protein
VTYRRLILSLPCLLVGLGVAPGSVAAQTCSAAVPAGTCTASTSTTITVGTVLQLSLSASATTLTPPTTAGYDAGFVADNGPATTVMANRSWTLRITAGSAFWTASNTTPGVTARVNKPAADLQWSTSPGGSFTGVTVAGTTFTSGGGTPPAGTTTTIAYRTLYSWVLDTPGAYSLVVLLTLTAP